MRSWSKPVVHATWHDGALCLWTWEHGRPGSSPPVHALHASVYGTTGPSGRVASVTLQVPDLGAVDAVCLRWPWAAAVGSFVGRPASPTWSASLTWFHTVAALAAAAVGSGRALPAIDPANPRRARWTLVADEQLRDGIGELQLRMPPVVGAAGPVDVAALVDAAADAAARTGLRALRWRLPPDGVRSAGARLVRATFRTLADDPPLGAPDTEPALVRELAHTYDAERARLLGEPLVTARVRMELPVLADDPWLFTLEVVADDDRSRWCTAGDALDANPLALDVAGDARHLPVLTRAVVRAASGIGAHVPPLAGLALLPGEPLALSLEDVGAVLVHAPALAEVGVELLGPEQLVRATARVQGAAAPPAATTAAGLNSSALVNWSPVVDDIVVDADDLLRAASAGAELMRVGDRWVRLDRAQVRRVLQTLEELRAQPAVLDAASLLKLATRDDLEVVGQDWVGDLLDGLPDDRLTEEHEPEGFHGELRHYQRRGLSWLGFLARLGLGGCLADDMGLGKTATTLAHLLRRPGPHLVVCPLSVVRNWEEEAARFAPSLRVLVHHGGERAQGEEAPQQLAAADLVITTYGLLTREVDTLAQVAWSTLVLDEAQAVKNPNTKAARAVRRVGAAQRLALTGTPMENRLTELWAVLDAVDPGLLGTLARFKERYAGPIERDRDELAALRLRRLTQPFLLRRTKADKALLPDLPDKVEQIAWAALTHEQAAMYQAVVDELLLDAQREQGMRRRGLILASLTRLKQICNHPAQALGDGSRLAGRSGKLARFDELVDELLDAGEQALVFTQYREMGELLARHLAQQRGLAVPFLHGGVAKRQRDAMVRRFQTGDGAQLLLVSLKAGGTGLNLTAASRVIHYDRWWNPAVEDQATDRAWRIGQQRTVFVHKLVCSGTLEERIGQLIDDKRGLAAQVVGTTGEHWLSELSTDELRDLVMLDGGQW